MSDLILVLKITIPSFIHSLLASKRRHAASKHDTYCGRYVLNVILPLQKRKMSV